MPPPPPPPAGVILSVWNPDASWERDDMLRVVATMGVPTQVRWASKQGLDTRLGLVFRGALGGAGRAGLVGQARV